MDGILLIDKPLLFTSHDVVDLVRRKIGIRRVGHAGTLDPMATGILVILVGRATSAFSHYEADEKVYEGVMTLGMRTDTHDLEGRILEMSELHDLDEAYVRSVIGDFVGVNHQRIPRYSSAKIRGRPLYQLARRNIPFEQLTKTIEIKELLVKNVVLPDIYFAARVSKGTYIRMLCDDIGSRLGVGGVLTALRRVQSGSFHVRDTLSIQTLKELPPADIYDHLIASGNGQSE